MSLIHITPQLIKGNVGYLQVITGGMKGDKTKDFVGLFDRLSHAHLGSQVFKPKCDYREELHQRWGHPRNYLVSRTGLAIQAEEIDDKGNLDDLVRSLDFNADLFGFDEVHLYDDSERLMRIILKLKFDLNKTIVVAGLDRNFRGEGYKIMEHLMAQANNISKLYGWCDINGCNEVGELPQRLVNDSPAPYTSKIKVVGASESYETRCLNHHEVPGKPKIEF